MAAVEQSMPMGLPLVSNVRAYVCSVRGVISCDCCALSLSTLIHLLAIYGLWQTSVETDHMTLATYTGCSPYPTLNLRRPSFSSRHCTDLEQSYLLTILSQFGD